MPAAVRLVLVALALPLAGCTRGDAPGLYVAEVDGSGRDRLADARGAYGSPVWSPDGATLRFVSEGDVHQVNADGSERRPLPSPQGDGILTVWSPDGIRLAAFDPMAVGGPSLSVVGADGAILWERTVGPPGAWAPGCGDQAVWSPDGTTLLFCVGDPTGGGSIHAIRADGSGQTLLLDDRLGAQTPSWSPDGTRIAFAPWSGGADAAPGGGGAHDDGGAALGPGEVGVIPAPPVSIPASGLYVMNADGSGLTRIADVTPDHSRPPAWSPDGTKLLVSAVGPKGGGTDLYVANADGSGLANLTRSADPESEPAWSPDGTRIAYAGGPSAYGDIFVINADGSGRTHLESTDLIDSGPAWSPDGTRVAFSAWKDDSSGH